MTPCRQFGGSSREALTTAEKCMLLVVTAMEITKLLIHAEVPGYELPPGCTEAETDTPVEILESFLAGYYAWGVEMVAAFDAEYGDTDDVDIKDAGDLLKKLVGGADVATKAGAR